MKSLTEDMTSVGQQAGAYLDKFGRRVSAAGTSVGNSINNTIQAHLNKPSVVTNPTYTKPAPATVNGLSLSTPNTSAPQESGLRDTGGSAVGTTPTPPAQIVPKPSIVPNKMATENPTTPAGSLEVAKQAILNPVRDAGVTTGNAISSAGNWAGEGIKNLTASHPSIAATGQTVGNYISNAGQTAGNAIGSAVAANPALAIGGLGAAALGGLGYMAYKKLKQKQTEKQNVVNNV